MLYTHALSHMYEFVGNHSDTRVSTRSYMYLYICTHVYRYLSIYLSIYLYIYRYLYTYIHIYIVRPVLNLRMQHLLGDVDELGAPPALLHICSISGTCCLLLTTHHACMVCRRCAMPVATCCIFAHMSRSLPGSFSTCVPTCAASPGLAVARVHRAVAHTVTVLAHRLARDTESTFMRRDGAREDSEGDLCSQDTLILAE